MKMNRLTHFLNLCSSGLAIMLNFNSSKGGLVEITDGTDISMESLFNMRAVKEPL